MASMVPLLFLTATAILAGPVDDLLGGYRREEGLFGPVYYRGGDLSRLDRRVELIRDRLEAVERRLRRRRGGPITVVLAPDGKEFARIASSLTGRAPRPWLAGLAFPGRGWILVREDDPVGGYRPWDRPEVTLIHELAHLVLHRRGRVAIPRWFDEGVSMWLSGGGSRPRDEARISGFARLGWLYPLTELEQEFPELHYPGSIAYQQSLMVVRFLVERHGETIIPDLLDGLEAGEALAERYRSLTGEDWATFEPEFLRWAAGRRSLIASLAALVDLWTLVTLLALVAIGVTVIRRRRWRRRLEAEEESDAG